MGRDRRRGEARPPRPADSYDLIYKSDCELRLFWNDQLEPLIERGRKQGIFRNDLPVTWQLAVIRAIVHTASREIQAGQLPDSEAETAMLSTALAAISASDEG